MPLPASISIDSKSGRELLGWLWSRAYLQLTIITLTWAFNTVLARYVNGVVSPVGLAYMRRRETFAR